jgi:probable phosphoglycerate mutase
VDQVGARADRAIERTLRADGDAALVAHAHFLRVLAVRWIGLPPGQGCHLTLDTGAMSVLGWERDTKVIDHWNIRQRAI